MGDRKFPFSAIIKKITAYFIVPLFLMLPILPMLIDEAGAAFINFSEYPVPTTITDQYQSQGVVFSGAPGPPYIVYNDPNMWPWPNPPAQVLSGFWLDQYLATGSIEAAFVNPSDGSPAEATNVGFYLLVLDSLAGVTATYYDINDNLISSEIVNNVNPFHFPSQFHRITLVQNEASAGLHLGNLSFQLANLGPQSNLGKPCPPPGDTDCAKGGDPCRSGCGSPAWSVNKINLNLYVNDIPLWYRSPIGPPVQIALSYNSKAPPASSGPFGNKWQLNYGSSLAEDAGGKVTVCLPDGRREVFTPNGQGGYQAPYLSHNTLVKTSSSRYELRFPDDTANIYDLPAGARASRRPMPMTT